MLKEFVNWCNENVGFISLILSALTLLVSVIAVFVSIHTARLPYKKKILVETGSYISNQVIGLHVTVTNVGNRKIRIKTLGFIANGIVYINKNTIIESQVMLSQGETTAQYFKINDLKNTLLTLKISPASSLKAFVEDSEGKKYKKKLTSVRKILQMNA
ncbi:MAG: hypothetical protein ACI4XI_01630 [Ruminococcus sp.]